jgi:hypothetical protein
MTIYHEFVHVKQNHKIDGFSNNKDYNALNEIDAYYYAATNGSLPKLNSVSAKGQEYGAAFTSYILSDGVSKGNATYYVNQTLTKLNKLLYLIPSISREHYITSVLDKTGIKLTPTK